MLENLDCESSFKKRKKMSRKTKEKSFLKLLTLDGKFLPGFPLSCLFPPIYSNEINPFYMSLSLHLVTIKCKQWIVGSIVKSTLPKKKINDREMSKRGDAEIQSW